MKKERIKAKVAELVLNEGQLPWLPTNPRQWTGEDLDLTKQSLERDPDFQEDNPLKVVALPGGELLVFAGNLRTTAAKALGWETFEAILYTPESEEDQDTIKRRAILDNGSFGAWDYDALANEWDDLPLADFGVPSWSISTRGDIEKEIDGMVIEPGSKAGESETGFQSFTFVFSKEEADAVQEYIENEGKEKLQAEILEICRNAVAK